MAGLDRRTGNEENNTMLSQRAVSGSAEAVLLRYACSSQCGDIVRMTVGAPRPASYCACVRTSEDDSHGHGVEVSDIERSGSLSMWQLFFTHPIQHRKFEFDAVKRSLFLATPASACAG
jgi:hypothetical protein